MSDDVADRAERLLEGVTKAPWTITKGADAWWIDTADDTATIASTIANRAADARFIAAARSLLPELVAELKTTRAQLRQVARQLGLFLEDGERNRVIVALAIADGKPKGDHD